MQKELLTGRDDIFVVKNFLSSEECVKEIAKIEEAGFKLATVNGSSGPVVNTGLRNNDRLILDDPKTAAKLFKKVEEFLPPSYVKHGSPIALNERFRYYRYESGQQFNWHFDGPYQRSIVEASWLTFMVYLNDEFTGGTTDFDFGQKNVIEVKPEVGMALVFMHDVYHRGAPVLTGKKYVMRSDVMYRTY